MAEHAPKTGQSSQNILRRSPATLKAIGCSRRTIPVMAKIMPMGIRTMMASAPSTPMGFPQPEPNSNVTTSARISIPKIVKLVLPHPAFIRTPSVAQCTSSMGHLLFAGLKIVYDIYQAR
jgi:hypothetical protein